MPIRIAVAQFAPEKAEVAKNLDTIAQIIRQSHDAGAELVLLPEACTSGYFLEGGVIEVAMTQDQLAREMRDRLEGKLDRTIDVALGFYLSENGNLYNAAAYLELLPHGPRMVHVYRKFFLPTYGVFDEERFVARGRKLGVFETRFGKVALLICEDVWHSILPTLCAVNGAQIFLVPAASPGRGFSGESVENHERYRRLFQGIAEEHAVFCINAQLCGFEGGKGFIGGSMVVDPSGRVIVQGPLAEEQLIIAEIDPDLVGLGRAQSPLIADLQTAWQDIKLLVDQSNF